MGDSEEPGEIKRLINSVYRRIQLVGEADELSAVLDPAAAAEGARLWEIVHSDENLPPLDLLNAMRGMAFLHWFRYQGLPGEQGTADLAKACEFFRRLTGMPTDLIPVDYPLVPADIRRIFTASDGKLPERAEQLSGEAARAYEEFQQEGHPAILGLAVALARHAVDTALQDDPRLPGYLSTLGAYLGLRYELAGAGSDLDASIEAGRRAASLIPASDPAVIPVLINLGNALSMRFELERDRADLDEAIEAGRRALTVSPTGDFFPRFGVLVSLAASLYRRFELERSQADLDTAIEMVEEAAAISPPDFFYRITVLRNLAAFLTSRFHLAGDEADLDAAIDAGQQAVAAAPPRHSYRPGMLTTLGDALHSRFNLTRNRADLDAAIDAQQQAEELMPKDHPNRTMLLTALGSSLATRFAEDDNVSDLKAALAAFKQASEISLGIPRLRVAAARRWGTMAAAAGLTEEATEGFGAAVRILQEAAWHGLNRQTRQAQIAEWAGLADDAAVHAVLIGGPTRAVELLEASRSVLWTQALNLRSDLAELRANHPEQANRLDELRAILDSPVPESVSPVVARPPGQDDGAEVRRRAARGWDQALSQIRALRGFEHFLQAVPYDELLTAADTGPIVIVIASRYGSCALVAERQSREPGVITLPGLSAEVAVDRAAQMFRALNRPTADDRALPDWDKARHSVLDILEWLWEVIAQPVLAAIGHTSTPVPGAPWPRLWWCPTGPLTVLPLHASGHHARNGTAVRRTDTVLDRVISSYTPTLAALKRACQPSFGDTAIRQLTVGMPVTPGLSPLPAVPDELRILGRRFPPDAGNQLLMGPLATRGAVLSAMQACSWLHMACHASQGHEDPDLSGFALWDAPLTIKDLSSMPSKDRQLAFLSACHTAAGTVRHMDEAIHLGAAMQFLGYRHVIATMWSINDSVAPQVADAFYGGLEAGSERSTSGIAVSLHQAIHAIRDMIPANPLIWAPYIHLGP